jgi:hypothetical protein
VTYFHPAAIFNAFKLMASVVTVGTAVVVIASDGEGPAGEDSDGDGPAGDGPAGDGLAGDGLAGDGLAGDGLAGVQTLSKLAEPALLSTCVALHSVQFVQANALLAVEYFPPVQLLHARFTVLVPLEETHCPAWQSAKSVQANALLAVEYFPPVQLLHARFVVLVPLVAMYWPEEQSENA